jgi:hypothetical protein
VLGTVPLRPGDELVATLAELALFAVLFTNGMRARRSAAHARGPARGGGSMPMQLQFRGEHDGIVVTYSTVFLAMVMPVRKCDDEMSVRHVPDRPLDTWFDVLDEDEPAKPAEPGERAAA